MKERQQDIEHRPNCCQPGLNIPGCSMMEVFEIADDGHQRQGGFSTSMRSFQVPLAQSLQFSGTPCALRKPQSASIMVRPLKRSMRGWKC